MATVKAVSYAIPSLDWNEHDHPRDPSTGEFIELGGGQFLFGKSKKATYKTKNGDVGVALKPGDVAFQTKTGNVYVQHADGTGHLYDPTKSLTVGQAVPVEGNLAKMAKGGNFKKIGENKAVSLQAKDLAEATDKIANPQGFKSGGDDKKGPAPAGKVKVGGADITLNAGDHAWTGQNDDMGEQEPSGVDLVGVVERADGSIEYYTDGEPFTGMTPDELKAWWEDDKQDIIDGWEKVIPDPEADPEDEEHDLTAEPDEPEVSPEDDAKESGLPAPKKAAEPKPDSEFKKKISDIVDESLKKPAETPKDAPESPDAPEAAPGDDSTLKHPVTGESIPVPEGKKVYQHKKFPNSFIFATGPDDTAPTFVNQTGKHKKKNGDPLTPPMDTFGLLNQNYNEVKAGSIGSPTPKTDALKAKVEKAPEPKKPVLGVPDENGNTLLDSPKPETTPAPKKASAKKAAAAKKPSGPKATPESVKSAVVGDSITLQSPAGQAGGTWSKVTTFTWQNDDNGATMTGGSMADLLEPTKSWGASTFKAKDASNLTEPESGTDLLDLADEKAIKTFMEDAPDGGALTMMKKGDWSSKPEVQWGKVNGEWHNLDGVKAVDPQAFANVVAAQKGSGTFAFIYAAPEFAAAKDVAKALKTKMDTSEPVDGSKPSTDAEVLKVLKNAPVGGTISHTLSKGFDDEVNVYTKEADGWKSEEGHLIPEDGFTGLFNFGDKPYTYNAPGKVKKPKKQSEKNAEIIDAALPGDYISVKGAHAAPQAAPMAEYVKGNDGTWYSGTGTTHDDAVLKSVMNDETVVVTEGKDFGPHVMEIKAQMASAKTGDGFVIQKPDGSLSAPWVKEANGKWTNKATDVTISPMSMMSFAEKDNLTVIPESPEVDAASAKKVQAAANVALLEKAWNEGLAFKADFSNDGTSETYILNASTGQWDPTVKKDAGSIPHEIMKQVLSQNGDTITGHALPEPKEGLKAWQGEVPAYISQSHPNSINADNGTAATFTHPVSGATFLLGPGDKVHQHKKSTDSFIITGASGHPNANTFFDKNGKEKNPPAHVLAKLDTNFEVTYEGAYSSAEPTVSAPDSLGDGPLAEWEKELLAKSNGTGSSVTMEEALKTSAPEKAVLIPPTPEPKKKVVKKKPKVAVVINEPKAEDQWQAPWGEQFNLLPGDEVLHTKAGKFAGEKDFYTTIRNGKVQSHYNEDGSNRYVGYVQPADLRTISEESGGGVVASREKGALNAEDFAPAKIGQTRESAFKAEKDIREAAGWVLGAQTMGYYFSQGADNEVFVNGESKRWGDTTAEDRTILMASAATVAAQAEAVLGDIAKWGPDQIDKSDKTLIGKTRNRFKRMAQYAAFAQEIVDYPNGTKTDDELKEDFAELHTLAQKGAATWGNDFPFEPAVFLAAMKTTFLQKRFVNNLQGIDFDPLNGTSEQYSTYAKSKGFDLMPALDPEMQKNWALQDMGYPNFTAAEKNALATAVKHAGEKIGLAELVSSLKSAAAVSAKSPQPKVPAYKKTQAALLTKDLEVHYDLEAADGKAFLDWIGPNQWEYSVGTGAPLLFDDAMTVSTLALYADQGNLPVGSDGLAYSAGDAKAKKDLLYEKHDVSGDHDSEKIKGMIDVLGGSGAHLMEPDEAADWVVAHVSGDTIAKHAIEKRAWAKKQAPHPSGQSANGSPLSGNGKIAFGALAAMMADTDWGKKVLLDQTLAMPDYRAMFDDLDLKAEYDLHWGKKADDLTNGQVLEATGKWLKYHVEPKQSKEALQTAIANQQIDLAGPPDPLKAPDGVSDEVWSTVSKMSVSTSTSTIVGEVIQNLTDEDLNAKINSLSAAKKHGVSSLNVSAVPPSIKRMYYWALTSDNPQSDEYALGLSKRIVNGDFLDEKQPVWFAPNGSKYPLAPGTSVVQKDEYGTTTYYIVPPKNESGSLMGSVIQWSNGSTTTKSAYMADHLAQDSEAKVLFTMPEVVTWAMAHSEHPEFFDAAWTALENIEQKALDPDPNVKASNISLTEADLTYAMKHDVLEAGKLDSYPNLKAQVLSLPEKMQQAVYGLTTGDNDALLSMMDYKAQKGVYAGMVKGPLFDPQGPIAPHISLGMTDTEGVKQWSPEAKASYIEQFGLTAEDEIPAHLDSIMNPAGQGSIGQLPETLQLKQVHGKALGGMHSKKVWIDQNNNEWMTKGFPSDPNAEFRIDVEHAANVIGRLMGFRQPQTRVQKVGGDYSYLQHLAPATGSLKGKKPKDLTLKQLQQAMEEHVADWITSNHDSHEENLLIAPDGNIFGIDKGQAFKFFGKDKLAHGYLPPGNGAPVWYDQFYSALKSGSLPKETVDEVTKAVLRKALRAQKADNAVFREHLAVAFAKHPAYPEGPERENYIDQIVERKNNTFNDFVDFYKSLYADSPYDFDLDTDALQKAKINDHTHVAISQDLADEAKKTGSFGKAVFFDSADFEDAHALIAVHKATDGSDTMAGELKLRKDADATLVAWLKNQQISGGSVKQQATPVPVVPQPDALPGMGMFFQKVKAGAITVNAHAPDGKTPDGQYNEGTLSSMTSAADAMKVVLAAMEQWEDTEPSKPFKQTVDLGTQGFGSLDVSLVTNEQHDAYKQALIGMVEDAARVIEAKEQKIKVAPHITEPTYTPSAGLNTTGKAKIKAVFLDEQGGTWTSYDDGGWVLTHAADGDEPAFDQKVSQTFFDKTSKKEKMLPQPIPDEEIDADGTQEDEGDGVTVTSMVGTVPVSVTKRTYQAAEGNFDPLTGQLTVSGEGNGGHHGYMYEIDFGGTRVTYMPWGQSGQHSSDDGVPPSQQGLLQFKHDKWDGSADSMQQVFSVLGSMGLDFQDASEESLELYYWRHMYGLIQDRKDGQAGGKYQPTIKAIQKEFAAKPEMTRGEELEMLRKAWALSIGQDKVDKAQFMPNFSRQAVLATKDDSEFTSGRPHWEHPEKDYAALHKVWNGSTPASAIKGSADGAYKIAMSGAALATEERLRVLGQWLGGMSSTSDQGYGSANFVFTRQNQNESHQQVHYHPRVAWRTHNYSFNGDEFGDQTQKKSKSFFDVLKSADRHQSDNELLIKNAMSTMDDIAVLVMPSAQKRNEVLKHYKDLGITTLHGLPIEEIFVMNNSEVKATLKKIWAQILADEKAGKPV